MYDADGNKIEEISYTYDAEGYMLSSLLRTELEDGNYQEIKFSSDEEGREILSVVYKNEDREEIKKPANTI